MGPGGAEEPDPKRAHYGATGHDRIDRQGRSPYARKQCVICGRSLPNISRSKYCARHYEQGVAEQNRLRAAKRRSEERLARVQYILTHKGVRQ